MKKYSKPEMKEIKIDSTDIIQTSGGLIDGENGDMNSGNMGGGSSIVIPRTTSIHD